MSKEPTLSTSLALRALLPLLSHDKTVFDSMLDGETHRGFKTWEEYWQKSVVPDCDPEWAATLEAIFREYREYEYLVATDQVPDSDTPSEASRILMSVLMLPNEVLEQYELPCEPICDGSPDRQLV